VDLKGVNTTYEYHRYHPIDLFTEYTICESLSSAASPYMIAMENPRPYGEIIGEQLEARVVLVPGCRICEIGGGYGSLMAGLLDAYSATIGRVSMVDLSGHLLAKQRKILEPWSAMVDFIQADATALLPALRNIDVLIMNEVIGDFDTWTDLDPANLPDEVSCLIEQYRLEIPPHDRFNFNMGAILLIEKICREGIPVFISEHSSDPIISDDLAFLRKGLELDGYPRRIQLKGHHEFTIRFSHLEKIARYWGRDAIRGSLIDIVGIKKPEKMRIIFTLGSCASAEHEILYEFLDHIREYQWLILR
jgi:hypothetical protein